MGTSIDEKRWSLWRMKNRTVIPANITVDIVRILTASMKLLANVLMIILASG